MKNLQEVEQELLAPRGIRVIEDFSTAARSSYYRFNASVPEISRIVAIDLDIREESSWIEIMVANFYMEVDEDGNNPYPSLRWHSDGNNHFYGNLKEFFETYPLLNKFKPRKTELEFNVYY